MQLAKRHSIFRIAAYTSRARALRLDVRPRDATPEELLAALRRPFEGPPNGRSGPSG